MDIELLISDGSVFTKISGVINAQTEFDEVYYPMYKSAGVTSWQEYTEPTLTTEEKIAALDEEYESQFTAITQAYLTALTAGDTTTATERQTDYTTLVTEYETAKETIESGS
ncbi:MAG: hypothetical protein H6Q73_929 [Firmicutes bacterium]|nr:hypothetical protein [Bacillota bacterium]